MNCSKTEQELVFVLDSNNGTFRAKRTYAFSSDVTLYHESSSQSSFRWPNARLDLLTSTTRDGKTLQNHTCSLYAALVRYDVKLDQGTAALLSTDYRSDHVVNRMYVHTDLNKTRHLLTVSRPQDAPNLLGGFQFAAQTMFQSTAYFDFGGAVSAWSFKGALANRYLSGNFSAADLGTPKLTWNDPMEDMISAIRELAFRAAIRHGESTDAAANATQSLPFVGTEARALYAIRRSYMIIAAALGAIPAIIVAFTLRGWWLLGRDVSSSPLELAHAFDAPLMRHVDDNARIKDLLKSTRDMVVQYDETVPSSDHDKQANGTLHRRRVFSVIR